MITCVVVPFLDDNYESYLIFVEYMYAPYLLRVPIKMYQIRTWCQKLYQLQQDE